MTDNTKDTNDATGNNTNTTNNQPISSLSPRATLDQFYAAEKEFTSTPPESQNFSSISRFFSPNFIMHQSSALPWAGTYHGPNGLKAWIEAASKWITIDVHDRVIFENTDDPSQQHRIVVLSTVEYTVRRTGERLEYPLSQTVDFDRDSGLILEIRSFYWDIAVLNRTMGYDPA